MKWFITRDELFNAMKQTLDYYRDTRKDPNDEEFLRGVFLGLETLQCKLGFPKMKSPIYDERED